MPKIIILYNFYESLFLQEHESEGGRTPLMKACRAGHLCTVQFLISKGANVRRQTTNNDHTPLSLACAGGHLQVVELLLAHRADPNHKLKVSCKHTFQILPYTELLHLVLILKKVFLNEHFLNYEINIKFLIH